MSQRKLNIVLYETEIAQNVGAIMRTCVAVDAKLHIIEPLGFPFDERHLSRPSANEFKYVDMIRYDD
jgi:tRNA (cytidine/uridine-2'-O-)-methyltransferase